MTNENKEVKEVENIMREDSVEVVDIGSMKPADFSKGFLRKHHINSSLTFKQGEGTDILVPVLNENNKVVKLARVREDGNFAGGEILDAGESLLVGRRTPEFMVQDLASACLINKDVKASAVVYRDEENLSVIAERFPESRIIGADSRVLEKYKGRTININGYEAKDNPRLHRRDFRTLEEFHRAGGDIYSLIGMEAPRFKIEQIGRAVNSFEPRPWIIQNLLPASPSLNMLYAPSGTAKTYFVLDWGATISTGEDNWFGLKVKQSSFLYLCGEGFDSIASRIKVWFQEKDKLDRIDDIPFYVVNSTFKFNDEQDMADFQTALEFYFNEFKPDVIAIDTMNLFMGGDENSTKDATSFIASLKDFALKNQCTILLVHHTGVMTEERARGSSAFFGAMDSVLAIWDNGHGIKVLEQKKSRNKKLQAPMAFELEEHVINGWLDPDTGEEMTDCIIRMVEEAVEVVEKGNSKHADNVKLAKTFLTEALYEKGQRGEDWMRVTRGELVEYAESSQMYKHLKTKSCILMNERQKSRPLGILLEEGILKKDSEEAGTYILIGNEIIDEVKKRIEEDCEVISDDEEEFGDDNDEEEYIEDEDEP